MQRHYCLSAIGIYEHIDILEFLLTDPELSPKIDLYESNNILLSQALRYESLSVLEYLIVNQGLIKDQKFFDTLEEVKDPQNYPQTNLKNLEETLKHISVIFEKQELNKKLNEDLKNNEDKSKSRPKI